jgi:hypothetical protein
VYKITGALPAAKLQEVINKGTVAPAGIVNDTPVASIIAWFACNPFPYLNADIVDPVGAVADPVPKEIIPAKDPVTEFPAVKSTPPKFTGMFAILLFFK